MAVVLAVMGIVTFPIMRRQMGKPNVQC
jgi:hypothetical protein